MSARWHAAEVAHIFPDAGHPVDPYLVWAELSQFAGFEVAPGRPVPVLLELASGGDNGDDAVARLLRRCRQTNPLNRVVPTDFCTSVVDRSELAMLADGVRAGRLVRFQLGLARGERELPRSALTLARDGIVDQVTDHLQTIGIVDDGCCLAHEAFRDDGRSRFVAVWDQDTHAAPDAEFWHKPDELPYGVELRIDALDALFARQPAIGEVAERALYAAIGRPEWGAETRRHGAGVLHVVADTGVRIVFVQLPGETVADSSGGSLGVYVLDGVRYIVDQTARLARREGCRTWTTTINVSLGSIAGPHDGTTITEMALAELGANEHVRIVLAAGNTANRNVHGVRELKRGEAARFDVMAPPDNPREVFVEAWLPERNDDGTPFDLSKVEVEVTSPDGSASPRVAVDQALRLANGELAEAGIVFCGQVAQGRTGTMVLLALRSTRDARIEGVRHARYGVWSITLYSRATKSATVHAWVERNDLIVGRRRPQQAYFVDDPLKPYVSNRFTLSSIANGANVTVVGAYCIADEALAEYSARGPTRGATRRGPDVLGPSDESRSLPGVAVGGFYSGSTARMSGTSVAAPHVTRWLVKGSPPDQRFEIVPPPAADSRRLAGANAETPLPAIRR